MFKKTSLLFTAMLFSFVFIKAQKVDSIYVHLYTDSLKKGTYNYINIDGRLSNGKYLPLDSSLLSFSSSAGKFSGNNLWVAPDFKEEKITIHVVLKKNNAIRKDFVMYIKKKEDGPLKTQEQVMEEIKSGQKKKG
ncbi:MAG: hypothetical protein ABI402_03745 [Ferruginibacter sp.]